MKKKRSPLDFALWKKSNDTVFWESPWGRGRPGWHIECSAMARSFLGDQIDIHGGGMDLIFPHHENEIAQTEALTDKLFARHWVHNAFVRIDQEKMSKSLGNFFTLSDVFEQYDPMVVRFFYLQHQYRNPLDFSFDELQVAHKNYQKLCKLFDGVNVTYQSQVQADLHPIAREMIDALCDDINTPELFGILYKNLKTMQQDAVLMAQVKSILAVILGLTLQPLPEKTIQITPEITQLIDQRNEARKSKNWALADALREKLKQLGIEVQDKA